MRYVCQAERRPERSERLLAEQAYHALRSLIVTLELAPGTAIHEPNVMARLRIGRTPVREALRRLALEGLVVVYPRRGMLVTDVDVRALIHLSDIRETLEPAAARHAAARAHEADRAALRGLLSEIESPRCANGDLIWLDERVHAAVYRAAHNDMLARTLDLYYGHALRIWHPALDCVPDLSDAVQNHAALLEAVLRRDGEQAARTMHRHVQSFQQAMSSVFLTLGEEIDERLSHVS